MSQNYLTSTSERNRRHFLRITAAAAAALTPFVASRKVSAEGNGNDDGTLPGCGPSDNQPNKCNCLLRGTEILTDHGSVLIESLQIGDLIQTESGDLKPVKWIGRSSIEKSSQAEWQESVLPIRIAQSAIDTNVPSRDLFLTPWHSLFIDGYLIPVQYLINGTSIVPAVPAELEVIEYFHIEFEQHEVMYADGLPVESLQVTGGHQAFANFEEYERLYGLQNASPMSAYAPILGYNGGRQDVIALARSAMSHLIDVRDPIQIAYDRLAARAKLLGPRQETAAHTLYA